MQSKFNTTLEHLKNDNLEAAISELSFVFRESPVLKSLVLCEAALRRIQRLHNLGLIDWDAVEARKDRIIEEIFDLITGIRVDSDLNDQYLAEKMNRIRKNLPKRRSKIIIIIVGVSALCFLAISFVAIKTVGLYQEHCALKATGSGTILQGIFEKLDQNEGKEHFFNLGGVLIAKPGKNFGVGSLNAIDVMLTENYDLALTATKFEPQLSFWTDPTYRNRHFLEMAISNDSAVLIVNKQNPLDTIFEGEVRRVLFGNDSFQINNWGSFSKFPKGHALADSLIVGILSRGEGNGESGIRYVFQKSFQRNQQEYIRSSIDRQDRRRQKGPKSICKDVSLILPALGIVSDGLCDCDLVKKLIIVSVGKKEITIPTKLYMYSEIDPENPRLNRQIKQLIKYLLSAETQKSMRILGFAGLDSLTIKNQIQNLGLMDNKDLVNLKAYWPEGGINAVSPVIYRLPR